jgi:hypothetical protein
MDIGKEAEEPVEYPIPDRAPARREAVPEQEPVTAPVEEPVHAFALTGAEMAEMTELVMVRRG